MNLHLKPEAFTDHAADFGFEHISFAIRLLAPGASFHELLDGRALVDGVALLAARPVPERGDFQFGGEEMHVVEAG